MSYKYHFNLRAVRKEIKKYRKNSNTTYSALENYYMDSFQMEKNRFRDEKFLEESIPENFFYALDQMNLSGRRYIATLSISTIGGRQNLQSIDKNLAAATTNLIIIYCYKHLPKVENGDWTDFCVEAWKINFILQFATSFCDCYEKDLIIRPLLDKGTESLYQSIKANVIPRLKWMQCIDRIGFNDDFRPILITSQNDIRLLDDSIRFHSYRLHTHYVKGDVYPPVNKNTFLLFKSRYLKRLMQGEARELAIRILEEYEQRFNGIQIFDIDLMSGRDFEAFSARLLNHLGYLNVQLTKASNDQGVDILAEKNGIRYAIQCKCYSNNLGNKPVQEINTGKQIYGCEIGAVLTNRYFTDGAKQAAAATGTLLWDRDKLIDMLCLSGL